MRSHNPATMFNRFFVRGDEKRFEELCFLEVGDPALLAELRSMPAFADPDGRRGRGEAATVILSGSMSEQPMVDVAADMATCSLCQQQVPETTTYLVNAQVSCAECAAKVRAELAAQVPGGANVLVAVAGGLAGALVGAAVWAGVAIATNFEVGYIAVLVGFLAGLGVKIGARTQRGALLQYLAAGLAVVGLFAAKFMLFAYAVATVVHEQGGSVSYFDGRVLSLFPSALGEMVNGFDALFLILALMAAYRVPKATPISINKV